MAGAGRPGDRRSQGEDARANAGGGDSHIATEHEAAAILKLRTRSGWWNGDRRALAVLREFAAAVREETTLPGQKPAGLSCTVSSATSRGEALQQLPGADVSAEQVRASDASMNAAPV